MVWPTVQGARYISHYIVRKEGVWQSVAIAVQLLQHGSVHLHPSDKGPGTTVTSDIPVKISPIQRSCDQRNPDLCSCPESTLLLRHILLSGDTIIQHHTHADHRQTQVGTGRAACSTLLSASGGISHDHITFHSAASKSLTARSLGICSVPQQCRSPAKLCPGTCTSTYAICELACLPVDRAANKWNSTMRRTELPRSC